MGRTARRWTDAEDIVQGVLVETVAQLPRLPEDCDAEELLRRVQRTASLRLTDAARRHGRLVGESVGPGAGSVDDVRPSEGSVTNADRRQWLEQLVARLPEKYAVVVRLCAFEELSCVEAAQQLGLEPDTVRKRYEHARSELERRLRNRDDV